MQYGVPYKGSKTAIAERLIAAMPEADAFVDLFAGGCAMTHCAMLSGKYRRFIINDIEPGVTQLFLDALAGKYHDEKRWIGSDDFFRLKDSDPYVRYCWSFGNNGREYIYGRDVEQWKKAYHYAVCFGDYSLAHPYKALGVDLSKLAGVPGSPQERRLAARRLVFAQAEGLVKKGGHWYFRSTPAGPDQALVNLERLQNLQSMQNTERLADAGAPGGAVEELEGMERLARVQGIEGAGSAGCITRYTLDYAEVEIPPGSVVYCDIPYGGKDGYGKRKGSPCFDHERFYDWAASRGFPVFISEYGAPDGRFERVLSVDKRVLLSAWFNSTHKAEWLFVQKRFAGRFRTAAQPMLPGME